jgi:hypothetical protein
VVAVTPANAPVIEKNGISNININITDFRKFIYFPSAIHSPEEG